MERSVVMEPAATTSAWYPVRRLTRFVLFTAKSSANRLTSIKCTHSMVTVGFYAAFILRLEVSHFFLMGRDVPCRFQ